MHPSVRDFMVFMFLGLAPLSGSANHLLGGSMYYDHPSGDQYIVHVEVYRDCATVTPFNEPLYLGVFLPTGEWQYTHELPLTALEWIPVANGTICMPGVGPCVEKGTYTGTITLAGNTEGYVMHYQRCCRVGNLTNVEDPGNTGITFSCSVPPAGMPSIGCPRFGAPPSVGLCLVQPFSYDHSAIDPDGDSLAYRLVAPCAGANADLPNPAPQDFILPVPSVIWASGYSEDDAIDSEPAAAIDPVTGLLTMAPTHIGNYALAVAVDKFRNGTFLATSVRELHFYVGACSPMATASMTPQIDPCGGLTVTFTNNSLDAEAYEWDFGEASAGDTSTLAEPSWTYSAPGSYSVALTAVLGECNHTQMTNVEVTASYQPSIAVVDNMLTASPSSAYQWSLDNGPIPGATSQEFTASTTGWYTVTTENADGCIGTSEAVWIGITGLDQEDLAGARIWPVPADEAVWVAMGTATTDARIRLFDLQGRCLSTLNMQGRSLLVVPLADLAQGRYLLWMDDAHGQRVQMIEVVR